jgi:hypothetical protein
MTDPALLATLCEEIEELRVECDRQGTRAALESIVTDALAGKPIDHRLPEIGLESGSAEVRWVGIPGAGDGHSGDSRYSCPGGQCARIVVADFGAVPRCGIRGNARMRRVDIP